MKTIIKKPYHKGCDVKNWKAKNSFDFTLMLPSMFVVMFVAALVIVEL